MARFRFKFEPVLRQRVLAEEQAQRELAQHLRLQMILLNQLRQMQAEITDSKHRLADALVGRVDLDRVGQFARFSGQASAKAHQTVARLGQVEKQIAAARTNLIHATAARKAMELLRDRHLAAWQTQQSRREVAELDEVATQQHVRAALAATEP